MSDVARHHQPS